MTTKRRSGYGSPFFLNPSRLQIERNELSIRFLVVKNMNFLKLSCSALSILMSCYLAGQPLLSEQLVAEKLSKMPVNSVTWSRDFEGTPFLLDTFMKGKIYMQGARVFQAHMRYSIFSDVMEVKQRGQNMQLLPRDDIDYIEMDHFRIIAVEYEQSGKKTRGFLFLLDSGEVSLLEKKNITFEEWRPARAQEAGPRSATFKASLDNFFIRSKNKITPITSLKELANLFPHHRSQVADYIKMHKIKLKEAKLVELFQYFNTTWTQASSQPKS